MRLEAVGGRDYDGLEELYASQNDWEGLAEVLSGAADRTADPDIKVDLSFRTARVLTDKIGAKERAFRSYERILSVRHEDLRSLAVIYDKSPADLTEELISWGVLDADARGAM